MLDEMTDAAAASKLPDRRSRTGTRSFSPEGIPLISVPTYGGGSRFGIVNDAFVMGFGEQSSAGASCTRENADLCPGCTGVVKTEGRDRVCKCELRPMEASQLNEAQNMRDCDENRCTITDCDDDDLAAITEGNEAAEKEGRLLYGLGIREQGQFAVNRSGSSDDLGTREYVQCPVKGGRFDNDQRGITGHRQSPAWKGQSHTVDAVADAGNTVRNSKAMVSEETALCRETNAVVDTDGDKVRDELDNCFVNCSVDFGLVNFPGVTFPQNHSAVVDTSSDSDTDSSEKDDGDCENIEYSDFRSQIDQQTDVLQIDVLQKDVLQEDVLQKDVLQTDVLHSVLQTDVIQADVLQTDVLQISVLRTDVLQVDIRRTDVLQIDVSQTDVLQTDVLQTHVLQTDVLQTDVLQTDVLQIDVLQTDILQTDVLQIDVSQTDVLQTDVVQTDVLQTDILQTDVLQTDILQTDVLQTDILQTDVLQIDVRQTDVLQKDVLQTDVLTDVLQTDVLTDVLQKDVLQRMSVLTDNHRCDICSVSNRYVADDNAEDRRSLSAAEPSISEILNSTGTNVHFNDLKMDVLQTDDLKTDVLQTDVRQADVRQTDVLQTNVRQTDVLTDVLQEDVLRRISALTDNHRCDICSVSNTSVTVTTAADRRSLSAAESSIGETLNSTSTNVRIDGDTMDAADLADTTDESDCRSLALLSPGDLQCLSWPWNDSIWAGLFPDSRLSVSDDGTEETAEAIARGAYATAAAVIDDAPPLAALAVARSAAMRAIVSAVPISLVLLESLYSRLFTADLPLDLLLPEPLLYRLLSWAYSIGGGGGGGGGGVPLRDRRRAANVLRAIGFARPELARDFCRRQSWLKRVADGLTLHREVAVRGGQSVTLGQALVAELRRQAERAERGLEQWDRRRDLADNEQDGVLLTAVGPARAARRLQRLLAALERRVAADEQLLACVAQARRDGCAVERDAALGDVLRRYRGAHATVLGMMAVGSGAGGTRSLPTAGEGSEGRREDDRSGREGTADKRPINEGPTAELDLKENDQSDELSATSADDGGPNRGSLKSRIGEFSTNLRSRLRSSRGWPDALRSRASSWLTPDKIRQQRGDVAPRDLSVAGSTEPLIVDGQSLDEGAFCDDAISVASGALCEDGDAADSAGWARRRDDGRTGFASRSRSFSVVGGDDRETSRQRARSLGRRHRRQAGTGAGGRGDPPAQPQPFRQRAKTTSAVDGPSRGASAAQRLVARLSRHRRLKDSREGPVPGGRATSDADVGGEFSAFASTRNRWSETSSASRCSKLDGL